MKRSHVFHGVHRTLHTVPRGSSPPPNAQKVSFQKLRHALEAPENASAAASLLAELRLAGAASRARLAVVHMDEHHLRWAFEQRFELFEVSRRRVIDTFDLPDTVLGPDPEPDEIAGVTFIALALVDTAGVPVPGRPYQVTTAKGDVLSGTLDDQGMARLTGLDPGSCTVLCPFALPHPKLVVAVADGDHLSGIAEAHGFDDYRDVWADPDNAALQAARSDPHVLAPGDALTIPARGEALGVSKPTGQKHTFTVARSPLKLRLTLLDLAAKPVAGAGVTVSGASLTTDDAGLVEIALEKSARRVSARLPAGLVDLSPGALDPSDEDTDAGWKARLFNMGFLWDASVAANDDEMLIAVEDFQAEHGLSVSGALDDATKSKIASAYGC